MLLTGDKALRQVAKEYNIEVHGTIWLVEQMIIEKVITVGIAKVAFAKMRQSGSRLPSAEITRILELHGTD